MHSKQWRRPQPQQRVIVLAGLPGAGKSTLAQRLQTVGWVVVNQDMLGSRKACEEAVVAALSAGKEVVIDRCNFNEQQRATWVGLARSLGGAAIALQLQVPVDVCIRRVRARADHPTLKAGNAADVIQRFAYDFKGIQRHEGFARVHVAYSQADVEAFVQQVGAAQQAARTQAPAILLPGTGPRPQYRPLAAAAAAAAAGSPAAFGPAGGSPFTPALQGAAGAGQSPMAIQPPLQLTPVTDGAGLLSLLSPVSQPSTPGDATPQGPQQQQQQQSNAVPFPGRPGAQQRPQPEAAGEKSRFLDGSRGGDVAEDTRPVLLFDLNGTLTSHTAVRRSAGVNRMRPGLHHLMRLHDTFRIGIFSSASQRTVDTVVPMLEKAAQQGGSKGRRLLSERKLILTRQHTDSAPQHHVANGGKAWDTVKPLHKWFKDLSRVILVDDDAFKALPGEEANMLLMPRWEETEDDTALEALVDCLLSTMGSFGPTEDVRQYTKAVQQALASAVGLKKPAANPEEIDLMEEDEDEADSLGEVMQAQHLSSAQTEPAAGAAHRPSLVMA